MSAPASLFNAVANMSLKAFDAWLNQAGSRKTPEPRFLARDECGCPLAVWLRITTGHTVYVGDDSVAGDDLLMLGDLPPWARAFVGAFDKEFANVWGVGVRATNVYEFLQRIKPALEALDHDE